MTRGAIGLDSVVVHGTGVEACESGGEVFMMSVRRGRYYGLGEVGSRIWRLLANPIAVADVCVALSADFEVDRPVLEAEVLEFLDRLAQEGLIRVVAAADLQAE